MPPLVRLCFFTKGVPMEQHIFGVTEVNHLVKLLLDNEPMLTNVAVRGELSNYKMYPSGHHYFTLKDPEGALRCVMFKGAAMKLRFRPENGMKVVVTGRITVFPRDGAYQLYCNTLTPEGAGDLAVAFEQLKAKLQAEGLFDPEHKKPLPAYPERIAIITSSAGAAVHDMIRILRRRYPIAKVILLPVRVQGVEAPPEIVGAIRYANRWKVADLIITGRGGGSIEDLWAFNEEIVARAIFDSEIPVISAVGHETDFTIADFVADKRAATPSAAAELAVVEFARTEAYLEEYRMRLSRAMEQHILRARMKAQLIKQKINAASPAVKVREYRMTGARLSEKLDSNITQLIRNKRNTLRILVERMHSVSPIKRLNGGMAYLSDDSGKRVSCANDMRVGEDVYIRMKDGEAKATIRELSYWGE